jgi:hypothetical protein
VSERFAAWGFDGRTAEARPARLRVEVASLLVESEDGERAMPIASLRISEAFDAAPCSVCTAAGESFQVEDGRGFARVLEAAGFRASPVVRLQRHSAAAAGAVALLVAALATAWAQREES